MSLIPCQRARFEIPEDIHYLNCAYMSPMADSVRAAMEEGAAFKARPWTFRPEHFFSLAEDYRTAAARMCGAAADDIAIVPSVSYALATAAGILPVAKGQEILVLADQFPSNVYPWRALVAATGARVRTVEKGNRGWTDAVLNAIGERTAIAALPHCHWADGGRLDLAAIGEALRKAGASLALDLTQSLGALRFDVKDVQPDFMVAAGYKWLLGPYSLGMLYVAPRWQDAAPLEQNWMNRAGSDDFARLVDYRDDYQPGARRFDMGEKSNAPQLMAGKAALNLLESWGVANIAETLGARTAALAEEARRIGLTAQDEPERAPHFLSLGFPDGAPADLPDRLAAENVFVSLRGQSLRVTPHLWVNDADCERLIAVLRDALG